MGKHTFILLKATFLWVTTRLHPGLIIISSICQRTTCSFNVSIFQLADDTSRLVTVKSLNQISILSSQVLGEMKEWCDRIYLTINQKKTSLIQIERSSNESILIRSKNQSIPLSSEIKFLGVVITTAFLGTH